MTQSYRLPMIPIKLADGAANEDVQLFRVGTFFHPKYGQFNITTQVLKAMEANFKLNVRGVDLAIDYKHDSDDVAAGWIKSVYLSDNDTQMWAKVDWTKTGAQVLSEKEFRYISPEFIFDYQDNETLKKFGPVLLGAGLTNRPTIKKMEPVVLSEMKAPQVTQPNKGDQNMDITTVTPDQVDAMSIDDLKALCKLFIADEQSEAVDAADPKAKPAAPAAPAAPADPLAAAQAKLAAAEKQLADMTAAKACSEKKSQFALLLSEGKACKAQEQAFISGDMAKFIALASPVRLNESGSGTGSSPAPVAAPNSREDAEKEVIKLAQAKMKDNSKLELSDAYRSVLSENKTLKDAIYA